MKTYAEFLRGFIGKKGCLDGIEDCWHFKINHPNPNSQLVDVGTDYAEFQWGVTQYFVPTSLLVVIVFRQ